MDKTPKQSGDLMTLVAWAHANQRRLIMTGAAVLVVGLVIGMMMWHKSSRLGAANEAMAKLTPPTSAKLMPGDVELYLKVANDYGDTLPGQRALLVAAGMLFDAGKFKDAQDKFEQFMREHPESALVNQASVGVAASLEAQGKTAEAVSRYEDLATRHGSEPTMPRVKSSLGRLYLAQNKPELALRQYEDLLRMGGQDSLTQEAMLAREQLLEKNPSLKKPVTPPPSMLEMLAPALKTNAGTTLTNEATPQLLNLTNK